MQKSLVEQMYAALAGKMQVRTPWEQLQPEEQYDFTEGCSLILITMQNLYMHEAMEAEIRRNAE